MSKHKHKIPYNETECHCRSNPIINSPFGINPSELLSMLGGNFNMNGLGNLLANMNLEGFNLNSMKNNIHKESRANYNTKDNDIDEKDSFEVDSVKMDSNEENDKNIQMLLALKTIVAPDRIEFIDRIIKLYKEDIVEENLDKNE